MLTKFGKEFFWLNPGSTTREVVGMKRERERERERVRERERE